MAVEFAAVRGGCAERVDSVAVLAGADQDYVRQKFGEHGAKPKAESYVLAQGSNFGGYLRDSSIEHSQFMDIAQVLAPDLAIQRYYPASDPKNADLLIVVHWGITTIGHSDSDPQTDLERLQKDRISAVGAVEPDLALMSAKSEGAGTWPEYNASLLGYKSAYAQEEYKSLGVASGMTETDRRLREDLMYDERYFVILMAYDYSSVKGGKKGVKPKLLWSNHFSMYAIGHNFATALPAMGKVAANFFGRNVDGLLLDAEKVPEGRVEVGEPKPVEEKKN
jgi:hypothetical protein